MKDSDDGHLVGRRRDGPVLIISMERAAKRNAIDRAMADALDGALNELDDDDQLWAGVLTGTADVFSAGSDLTVGGDYRTARGGEYGIIRRRRRKPLVAAVEGPALGGGLEIALSCDLVVASTTARFGLPEVRIGVVPTCAGLFRTPRALPLNVARQLILTGQPIAAPRAHEVGFVNVLTEPGAACEEAVALAKGCAPTRPSRCRRASPPSTPSSAAMTTSAGRRPSGHSPRLPVRPMPARVSPPSWRSVPRSGQGTERPPQAAPQQA